MTWSILSTSSKKWLVWPLKWDQKTPMSPTRPSSSGPDPFYLNNFSKLKTKQRQYLVIFGIRWEKQPKYKNVKVGKKSYKMTLPVIWLLFWDHRMEQTPKSQTKTTWPTPWENAGAVLCTIWAVRLSRTIQNTFERLKLHSTAVALPLGWLVATLLWHCGVLLRTYQVASVTRLYCVLVQSGNDLI